jgi:PKHD-type hydroxylase
LDKRSQLGTEKNRVNSNEHQDSSENFDYIMPIYDGVIIPSKDQSIPGYASLNPDNAPSLMFTKDECEKILSSFEEAYPSSASVGANKDSSIKRNIRSADIYNIEQTREYRWIFDKLARIVSIVNINHFDYDLVGITHTLQLIRYNASEEVPGHYDWHIDAGSGESATRKISLTVQLTDPYKYKGCDLEVFNNGGQIIASREQGTISLFPSYMPHRVTPIEEGERYALVIWIHGTRRFR